MSCKIVDLAGFRKDYCLQRYRDGEYYSPEECAEALHYLLFYRQKRKPLSRQEMNEIDDAIFFFATLLQRILY